MEFLGYERPDGQAGTRNYVTIIPATNCVNEMACEIADDVAGTVPLLHNHGCLRLKPDNDRAYNTLVGLGRNPNVAAALIVGVGCDTLDPDVMAQDIALTGKPVEVVTIKSADGYQRAIDASRSIARSMMAKAELQQRVPLPLGLLSFGVKCGGSATISSAAGHPTVAHVVDRLIDEGGTVMFSETAEVIGAEHILANRAATDEVRNRLLEVVGRFEQMIAEYGVDIRGAQPTPGNILSGLTTIEEKSLGALAKTGTRPLAGVLEYGETPQAPGLYLMDGPAWTSPLYLGMASAGSQMFVFSLGGGLPGRFPSMPGAFRIPVVPTIKVTGDPTLKNELDYFDFYAGGIIEGTESKESAGERFLQRFVDIASGAPTRQEFSKYREVLDIYATGPMM